MKKIAYVLALLLTLSLEAYDSAISAKEVLYLPEEEKIELIGDISLTFEGWKFLAERGEFHIEEKKLLLQGNGHFLVKGVSFPRYEILLFLLGISNPQKLMKYLQ